MFQLPTDDYVPDMFVQNWVLEASFTDAIATYVSSSPTFIPYTIEENQMALTQAEVAALRLRIYRNTTAPTVGNAEASAMYIVKDANAASRARLYVTSSDGAEVREVSGLSESEVNTLIDSKLLSHKELLFTSTITTRDNLALDRDTLVLVQDATGDSTVNSGAAYYYYVAGTNTWNKVAEFEGMDLTVTWDSIDGRPNVTVAQLEQAVAMMHEHANKAILDGISLDTNGFAIINNINYRYTYMDAASQW